jgi:hypothetical protein
MSLKSDDDGIVKHFVRLSNGEVLCIEEAKTELIMGRHLPDDGIQVWVCSINEFGVQSFSYASEASDALVEGLKDTVKEEQDES